MTQSCSGDRRPTRSHLTADEQIHWLALRMTPGLGTRKAGQLLGVFRSPQAIFRASRSELEAAGLAHAVAQSLASGCGFEDAADQQQRIAAEGVELVPLIHPDYPAMLREIFDPPPLLFAKGRLELLSSVMLGVVGTRRPTAYGKAAATRLAKDLAESGLTVVSGMARGIDTSAHSAVLDAGGDTIAVFGSGIDQIYPAENRKIAEGIATKGLLLTEFPMGSPPYPQNFPIRNRIISGMSVGVLVVEGSEYSGSAITAKLAAEQNRGVFAVPGSIMSKMSWGPNLLIKQGAKLVQEWSDVVVELSPEVRRKLLEQARNRLILNEIKQAETCTNSPASNSVQSESVTPKGVALAVLNTLRPDAPQNLDALTEALEGTSVSEVLTALFELEMAGLIRQMPGKNYVRVWND
ncbi:MAG: DNA-processing protein DprA [Bryobacteraceae bacterium]